MTARNKWSLGCSENSWDSRNWLCRLRRGSRVFEQQRTRSGRCAWLPEGHHALKGTTAVAAPCAHVPRCSNAEHSQG